jgi:predicted transcriptional regulator
MIKIKLLITFLVSFLYIITAQAGLLGRIEIEEVLKKRLEHALKIQDPTAQVTVRIEYNKYLSEEDLPGTNQTANTVYYSENVEISDIKKLHVQYFSEKKEISADQKDLVYSLLPLERKDINFIFKSMLPVNPKVTPIEVKDINEIANKSIYLLSLMLGSAIGLACLIFGFALFFNNSKNRNLFKAQFSNLVSALSSGGFNSSGSLIEKRADKITGPMTVASQGKFFEDYSKQSLIAIFSDLYWCKKDEAASYLWNNISNHSRALLLEKVDFIYDYAMYFSRCQSHLDEETKAFVMHPYYIQPLSLNQTAQEELLQIVKKNYGLWNKISPLRQQSLSLSLKEKIKANSSLNLNVVIEKFPISKPRVLPQYVNFGDISFEDESEIFNDDKIIPQTLREYVPSLVWLASKEVDYIKEKLEKLDAKFLASAWVGAPEILEKLENCLPEKKQLLLKSYLKTSTPSKTSPAFQALFELGLENSHYEQELIQKAS